jgi:hypothetical protein
VCIGLTDENNAHGVHMLPFLSSLALCSPSAAGGSLILDSVPLTADASAWTDAGVGAPGIDHNPETGRWVMTFESQVEPPSDACPDGAWAIGAAVSGDGGTWRTLPAPVVAPGDRAYLDCGVRHPTPLWHDGTLHLWFTALHEGGTSLGIGHGRVDAGRFVHDTSLAMHYPGATQPSVNSHGGSLHMVFEAGGQLHAAHTTHTDSWRVEDEPTLAVSGSWWSEAGLFSPSLSCREDSSMPHILNYLGASTFDDHSLVTWSYAIASEIGEWYLSWSPIDSWTGDAGLASVEVLHAAGGASAQWFEVRDSHGRPEIRRALSDSVGPDTEFYGHSCR